MECSCRRNRFLDLISKLSKTNCAFIEFKVKKINNLLAFSILRLTKLYENGLLAVATPGPR